MYPVMHDWGLYPGKYRPTKMSYYPSVHQQTRQVYAIRPDSHRWLSIFPVPWCLIYKIEDKTVNIEEPSLVA